ncbi:MFS transporter [Kocuria coralli]|uniref:MFS transporter n=1 Tax=Kocuria coralli TaxID=1461025 RepID=A0A5J5L147_9MICC|nr:MFS transporter [Kocuria coralli]KAA9395360.1 MFS transporter [Kocuria coralli]
MSTTAVPAGTPRASGPAPRKTLVSWYLYDVAISVIDALMITFVFTTYLTSSAFGTPEYTSQVLSIGTAIAAVSIAVFAPLIGRLSDRSGRRSPGIAILTGVCVLATAACYFVAPAERMLLLGVILLSTANAAKELAAVDYYAVLPSIAEPDRVGRISGRGWAAGYIGSILATAFVLFGFVSPGFVGLPTDDAVNVRAVALFCAVWCAAFAVPLVISLRRRERLLAPVQAAGTTKSGLLGPYREILAMVGQLWRTDRLALFFLVASAVFRDGLSGIFTFGGVIAAGTFGFSLAEVMAFAIAGNLAAGAGALLGGQLDDRFGPKAVIVTALVWVIAFASPLLFLDGHAVFWVCGLALCLAVGPAQASSRAYLARLTTEGTEGSLYGLYATTGRAVSFLAPGLFALSIYLFGAQRWGILGILSVVVLGLLLMLPLPDPRSRR